MVQKREAYAPWSLTRKAGVESATVNGDIEVPQFVQPVIDTGFVDEKGNWKGRTSSDEQFLIDATHESVVDSGAVLSPQATPQYIDMTGFQDLTIALKVSNAGAFSIVAVMAPGTNYYANLTPVDGAATLKGAFRSTATQDDFEALIFDSETLVADVWNIFQIQGRVANQKLLQFKLTNSSGGASNIDFAYMRMV